MKNLILKLFVGVAVMFLTLSCACYNYPHEGWSDFPKDKFTSLLPYEVGDTITFLSSTTEDNIEYIVTKYDYSYQRDDSAIPCGIETQRNEVANIEVELSSIDGETMLYANLNYQWRWEFSIDFILYSSKSSDDADSSRIYDLSHSERFDYDNTQVKIEQNYNIIYSPLQNTNISDYETIEYDIEQGIGISRILLDDIEYFPTK